MEGKKWRLAIQGSQIKGRKSRVECRDRSTVRKSRSRVKSKG